MIAERFEGLQNGRAWGGKNSKFKFQDSGYKFQGIMYEFEVSRFQKILWQSTKYHTLSI